jgi:hypothetical protein
MNQVKLMNRIDRKYWFNSNKLPIILNSIKDDYYILSINGESIMPYATTYYDTLKNQMFTSHHNGKLNRYKVRRRTYVSSGVSFLEVKAKNNKGRTIKQRIPSPLNAASFSEQEMDFINENTPFSGGDLQPSLENKFHRLTLVNKDFSERCTIDTELRFNLGKKQVALEKLTIIELKSDAAKSLSKLALLLRDMRIRPSGFSKYCMGKTYTDKTVKHNGFKEKVRDIEKATR